MATTSLWHIKGRLKDLMAYVEDPAKTTAKDMKAFMDVFDYVQRPEATEQGRYVTAINCLKETALQQMILTKKRFDKEDKYIAWHGYQSFRPGEVTEEECHKIGVELAAAMWGDRFQIIVTTHLDKGHLHNHFCFNSVSFRDGKKYNYSKGEMKRLRDTSDRLCKEHGLSVIQNPHKAPSRPVWLAEKDGKPTRYEVYRKDLYAAIEGSRRLDLMEAYLNDLGYETDFTGKHWKMKLPQYKHFTRLDTLDDRMTPQFIRENVGCGTRYGSTPAYITWNPDTPEDVRVWEPFKRTDRIYRLYLYYQYQLGILPKRTWYKPTSPCLIEDLRYMDELDRQTTYMAKHGIETDTDLKENMEQRQKELDTLVVQRTKLQNKLRRAEPETADTLRQEKTKLTEQILQLRVDIKTCRQIQERTERIRRNLQQTYDAQIQAEERKREARKLKNKERKYER